MSGKPNRLIHSTSPYLLQHAYNPVDWFEWSKEAFDKATQENKPVLVSIGYSACHWCHVMERESFENDDIAVIMNQYFICIKVDREERPDIDQVYMDAVQAMGIHGGWPLNVFLTSNQRPFYGGTYFPPNNWSQLLRQINLTYAQKREEILQSGEELMLHLNRSDIDRFTKSEGPFKEDDFHNMFRQLETKFDPLYGGLDKAPKFVMPSLWMWLIRYHNISKNKKSLEMAALTLQQLLRGGIYDQVGGGFARYSVDERWFAPHFEKMLYDNAQLVSLYSEAYRVTPDADFKMVVYETVAWLRREMLHPEGGFYSALDADSEGEEGKYYTWTADELQELLGNEFPVSQEYFQVSLEGNWEQGRNILHRKGGDAIENKTGALKNKLLAKRAERTPPSRDDKVLLGWNAMMVQGLLDAYNAFSDIQFLELAIKNMEFLENKLIAEDRCYRVYKNKRGETEAFLEDYAFLIRAYTSLYQATFSENWLAKAKKWCAYVLEHFWDESEGYFYFSGSLSEKLIARKKEVFDNVIPSSNSVMANNLFLLGTLLDEPDWKAKAVRMVSALKKVMVSEISYSSNWSILALEISFPFAEIAIVGPEANEIRNEFAKKNIPLALFTGTQSTSRLPLLKDKSSVKGTTIYVCFDSSCKTPVFSVDDALKQIESSH